MTKKKYTAVTINLSASERDQVHDLARRRGYKITSDYLRALIEADAAAHGEVIEFEVDRGGYRERSAPDELEE
jgi:hypothetical protein